VKIESKIESEMKWKIKYSYSYENQIVIENWHFVLCQGDFSCQVDK